MHNWDYPKTERLKENKKWYLERALTYGLDGEKLNRKLVEKHLKNIKIPDDTRAFLELLLWDKPF